MINDNETQNNGTSQALNNAQAQTQVLNQENEPSIAVVLAQAKQEQTLTLQQAEPLSIKPSIAEIERFIQFLNQKFDLKISNDLIISIEETSPSVKGFFRSVRCPKIWKIDNLAFKQENAQAQEPSQDAFKINSIVLSSHTLKDTPYETIAHELAHYVDFKNNGKGSKNNYHTLSFKKQAERLFLSVQKVKNGWAFTSETDEFKKMLCEFEPSQDAFKIFQTSQEPKTKQKSRLLLFMCSCGDKIRTAKNEGNPLNAVCLKCGTEFKNQSEGEQ